MTFTWVDSLTKEELNSITKLHTEALKESFLTNFGPKLLSNLYQRLAQSPQNHILLVKSNDKTIGFLVAVSSLKSQLPTIVFDNWQTLALKPNLTFRLLDYLFQNQTTAPVFELQFISLDKKFRGRGIGTKMITKLSVKLASLGQKHFLVGTKKDDVAANSFYRKNGFKFLNQKKLFGDTFNYYYSPT